MTRYARNIFYLGFAQQAAKGTDIAPVYFPQFFDGDVNPNPDLEHTEYVPADGQFQTLSILNRHKPGLDFRLLATPQMAAMLIAYALGSEQVTGTQPGTPIATTLTGVHNVGVSALTVGDTTGLQAGDIVQLVAVTATYEDTGELVEIDAVTDGTHLALATATQYAHAGTAVVEKVVAPYHHKCLFEERPDMPWFTVEASVGADTDNQTDPLIVRFIDCRISELRLSVEPGMPLMVNATIEAVNLEKQESETAESHESNRPFVAFNASYTIDSGETSDVTRFELTLRNALDEDDFTDGQARADLPVLRREGELTWTIKLADGTRFFDTHFNGDHDALATVLDQGTFVVDFDYDETTANRGLNLNIPQLEQVEARVNPGAADGTYEYACRAIVTKKSGSEFFTITIDNDQHLKFVV